MRISGGPVGWAAAALLVVGTACSAGTTGNGTSTVRASRASGTPTVSAGPSAAATIVSSGPGIFVGSWSGHGRGLVVTADGTATISYRTYTFCSQDPTPPCDSQSGDTISAGGLVVMRITQVVTANHRSVATAVVQRSNHADAQGSTESLSLNGDVITIADFGTFCDAKAAATGACGA